MNDQVAQIFIIFLYVLIFAIVGRALLSWFPMRPNNPIHRILFTITEPLLEPVRRIMPRTGMVDLSAMVVIILLYVMVFVFQRAAEL